MYTFYWRLGNIEIFIKLVSIPILLSLGPLIKPVLTQAKWIKVQSEVSVNNNSGTIKGTWNKALS